MATKKSDLEIIYTLQWKNKPANGGDKANIVGVYDIPATTLNWEIFKSYLLKNAGLVEEDVKVSYITDSNREFPIESQTDFQIALYAFRRKARSGHYVTLLLERTSDQPTHKNLRHSNDVETQSENHEPISLSSACCNIETPEWFTTYMSQFKKEITEELIATMSSVISNVKPTVINPPVHHLRKTKLDCPKRIRKLPVVIGDVPHEAKDLKKSRKLEGKLERKLEKLEHKTKKIKEKKRALLTKSSDSDGGQSSGMGEPRPRVVDTIDVMIKMDAEPIGTQDAEPHLVAGTYYLHQWLVRNSGRLPWTSKTTLRYSWGAKTLYPQHKIVQVPHLQPGDTGVIYMRFQLPTIPGEYECYFHFYHEERRFGQWLGCRVIVDNGIDWQPPSDTKVPSFDTLLKLMDQEGMPKIPINNLEEMYTKMREMELRDRADTDSDNQSALSGTESISSFKGRYVLAPIPSCFKIDDFTANNEEEQEAEDEQKIGEDGKDLMTDSVKAPEEESIEFERVDFDDNNNSDNTDKNSCGRGAPAKPEDSLSNDGSEKSDIVVISIPNEEEEDRAGYAYLLVDGHRLPIPKKILNSEYLKLAEDGAGSSKENITRSDSATSFVEVQVKNEEAHVKNDEAQVKNEEAQVKNEEAQVRNEVAQAKTEEIQVKNGQAQIEATADAAAWGPAAFSNPEWNPPSEMMSHCSTAGSCFSDATWGSVSNSRLFMFPQNSPGFEVVDPKNNPIRRDVDMATGRILPPTPTTLYPQLPTNAPPLNLSTHNRNPFTSEATIHVPNYQQTPPEERTTPFSASPPEATTPPIGEEQVTVPTAPAENVRVPPSNTQIHILPESLVSGAVNVASSAMNTARSVINMIVPQEPGRWVNGHWVSTSSETPREANLQALAEMGFWNRDLNATLLARYKDDLSRVVAELVQ